jgi:hypothetical protein
MTAAVGALWLTWANARALVMGAAFVPRISLAELPAGSSLVSARAQLLAYKGCRLAISSVPLERTLDCGGSGLHD